MKSKNKARAEYEAQVQAERCVIVVHVKDVWIVELRFATHAEAEAHIAKKVIKSGYVIPEMIMPPFSDMTDWRPIVSFDTIGGMLQVYEGKEKSLYLLDRTLYNLDKQAEIVKLRGSARGITDDNDRLAIVWRFLAFENRVIRDMIKHNDNRADDHIKAITSSMAKQIEELKRTKW